MSVRLHLYCFLRKFVFDVLPAALASLVGALFFAHQWTQTPPRVDVARVTAQNEQIATMIRDEQMLMRTFLQREHELAAQRQAPAAKDAKDKEPVRDVKDRVEKEKVEKDKTDKVAKDKIEKDKVLKDKAEKDTADATASVRRRVEPPREANYVAATAVAPPAVVEPAVAPAPVITAESGPLVAPPEPPVGIITRIVSATIALTNQVADTQGVPAITGLVPSVPAMDDKSDLWPSGHVLDTKR